MHTPSESNNALGHPSTVAALTPELSDPKQLVPCCVVLGAREGMGSLLHPQCAQMHTPQLELNRKDDAQQGPSCLQPELWFP